MDSTEQLFAREDEERCVGSVPKLTRSPVIFNILTLVIPNLSTIYFIEAKKQRLRDINRQIDMKSSGKDGWNNYSTVIQRQWN
ncbi:hypothetical protein COOONC_14595 [Cooperia oncophora]